MDRRGSTLEKVDETAISEENSTSEKSSMSKHVDPRVDIVVDLEAPYSRHNLNRLLYLLYNESPFIRVFVNKWEDWDQFGGQNKQM